MLRYGDVVRAHAGQTPAPDVDVEEVVDMTWVDSQGDDHRTGDTDGPGSYAGRRLYLGQCCHAALQTRAEAGLTTGLSATVDHEVGSHGRVHDRPDGSLGRR